MNHFDDLLQRVSLFNKQLATVEDRIGSDVRMLLHRKLWELIAELNVALGLNLENTCLDLTADSGRLRIHYWTDGRDGAAGSETSLFIDRDLSCERHTLSGGQVSVERSPRPS